MSLVLNAKPSRSGSETRRRDKRLLIRLDANEYAEIAASAEAAGLTLASYTRQNILSGPVRKPSRRAHADTALLSKVLAELARVGSNLNQIARALSSGDRSKLSELPAAPAIIRAMAVLVMRALGYRPDTHHH